ncbi:MAG: cell division control protein Cdc6 [Candidatus Micrarchaeota archaeon]|nr:MAG: cell division control protein Cdc6 [Candidatus Micrarchaeota archaeon]
MNDKGNPFLDLLKDSKIFKNHEVLSPHYIPEKLLYRDNQIKQVVNALAPAIKGQKGRNVFIYGKTGTGKTSCILYVLKQLKDLNDPSIATSYINCRIYSSKHKVLSKIIKDHMPYYSKRGIGSSEFYERLVSWISDTDKKLIVVLDEIDLIKDLDDTIYTFTRINSEVRYGSLTIVGIANKISFKDQLDPRSVSSLYENEVIFPPYDATELYEILNERAKEAFKDNVISDELLRIIAAKAAREGDARYALKILEKAAEIADSANKDKIEQEDVDKAIKSVEEDLVYDLIETLPQDEMIILYAIALITLSGSYYKKLTDGYDTFVFSGEIYQKYVSLCRSLNRQYKSERWYRKYISDLSMLGLIETFESSKGIRGHTKLVKLNYPSDKVKSALERVLFSSA